MLSMITIIVLSYLAGSIPTSIICSKLFRGIDLREHGSGNAGGTNAIRVLGWKIGVFVMLIDVGKGVLATLLISQIRIDPVDLSPNIVQIIAGMSAIFGHIWTIFAGFKGGKGVGTAAGMLFALYPIAGFVCLVIFFLVLLTTRYVSLSSMSAAVAFPIVVLLFKNWRGYSGELIYFAVFIAVLIVFTHRSNIKRLLKGEESKAGRKKPGEDLHEINK
ncbi:glycerol-3-phosphate 1-O-acyltransferase PlsY [candidate division KSB1 bacterium]|nr:glycerol-3-phosphate 1-O-acyltransferase PlsY [candidate division KSB1 bacterium]MBL7095488.1 glycerol-3-phosphate 1-O-acyltransferase PlsY [candidate division KSB1 bacterium]